MDKKKSFERMLRRIIREEIKNALTDVITEAVDDMVAPTNSAKPKKRPTKRRTQSPDMIDESALNFNIKDILNETKYGMSSADFVDMDTEMEVNERAMTFDAQDARGFGATRQMSQMDNSHGAGDADAREKMRAKQMMANMDFSRAGIGPPPAEVDDSVIKAMTRDYSALVDAMDKKKR